MEMTFEKETVYDEKSGTKIESLRLKEDLQRKPDSLEDKAKTLGELNPCGKEEYCRGCYKKESECPKCNWNTEKWVLLSEVQTKIDSLESLLLKYNDEALAYEKKVNEEREGLKQKLELARKKVREDIEHAESRAEFWWKESDLEAIWKGIVVSLKRIEGVVGAGMRVVKVGFSEEAWDRLMRERKCTLTVRRLETDVTIQVST